MTKRYLLAIGLMSPLALAAQTRTSVANGNATNPFTWDCTCIPLPGNDIVINHNVILDSDFGYTSGSVTINAPGSLTGTTTNRIFGLSGGSFVNNGTFNIYNLYFAGGTFTNNGTIHVTNGFAVTNSVSVQNNNTLTVDDSLLLDLSATLTNPGTTNARYTLTAGSINNTGSFSGDDLYSTGLVTNNGSGMSLMNVYSSGTIINNSLLELDNDLWNSETVINNHQVVIGHDLMNGDTIDGMATLTNNGAISVAHDLNNSETLNGTGSYCIANASNNAGDVSGSLYICDQTGNDFDINVGTVAGTVTFCSSGSCLLGVNDVTLSTGRIYPNPAQTQLNIEMEQNGTYSLAVLDASGKTMETHVFNGHRTSIDVNTLAPGLYFYRINGGTLNMSGRLIKE